MKQQFQWFFLFSFCFRFGCRCFNLDGKSNWTWRTEGKLTKKKWKNKSRRYSLYKKHLEHIVCRLIRECSPIRVHLLWVLNNYHVPMPCIVRIRHSLPYVPVLMNRLKCRPPKKMQNQNYHQLHQNQHVKRVHITLTCYTDCYKFRSKRTIRRMFAGTGMLIL